MFKYEKINNKTTMTLFSTGVWGNSQCDGDNISYWPAGPFI